MTALEVFDLFLEDCISFSGDKYTRLRLLNVPEIHKIIKLRNEELEKLNGKGSQNENS